MTEKKFIEQNIEKWRQLEGLLLKSTPDPDQLHELFVKVSSDLSYARTFYPNRSVRLYLNRLTQEVFDKLGKKKQKFDFSFIQHFFGHILPLEIYRSRKAFYISFVVFALAVLIGVISARNDLDFVTTILGDSYVSMTEDNINEGDPMKVYKDSEQMDMFLYITLNNIYVSFLAFILGILGIIGTVYILISNGIMLGAFQYFFYAKGLFMTSFLTIWIHGTIEISAIIIAGAAGIVLGSGLLFPGTYKRSTALQISAMRGIRIIVGTIPLFILASMLESFVTRHTGLPTYAKIMIIGGSLLFILWMWVFYPWYYYQGHKDEIKDVDIRPSSDISIDEPAMSFRDTEENFSLSIVQYKKIMPGLLKNIALPALVIFAFAFWYDLILREEVDLLEGLNLFRFGDPAIWFFGMISLVMTFLLLYLSHRFNASKESYLVSIKRRFFPFLVLGVLIVTPIFFIPMFGLIVVFFIALPPHFFVLMSIDSPEYEGKSFFQKFKIAFYNSWSQYINYILEYLLVFLMGYVIYSLLNSDLASIITSLFTWHEIFDYYTATRLFLEHIYWVLTGLVVLPFFFFTVGNKHYALLCKDKSYDLVTRFEKFGQKSNVFESL